MINLYIETTNRKDAFESVEDLSGRAIPSVGDGNYQLEQKWHLLKIPYKGEKIEITDIKLNHQSIKHLIYTGYFKSKVSGKIHQPATAVWEDGDFEIWFFPSLGTWQKQVYEQIENGKFGQNLFEDYMLTVDRPVAIAPMFPENVKGFFADAVGPVWWKRESVMFPYRKLDIEITREVINAIDEIESTLPHNKTINGWIDHMSETPTNDADPKRLSTLKNPVVERLLGNAGYSHVLSYSVLTLNPGCYIDLHVDDHTECKNPQFIKGCQKFYMSCEQSENVYFKLGSAGLVPLDTPLIINTNQHTHSVVNQSSNPRKVFMAYGVLTDPEELKLLENLKYYL
jgi:hypothetical protein